MRDSFICLLCTTIFILIFVLIVFKSYGFTNNYKCCHEARKPHGNIIRSPILPPAAVFISFGQSNSECFVFPNFVPPETHNIYVYYNEETYQYTHPMAGSESTGACLFYDLGISYLKNISSQHNSSVIFALAGCGGFTVKKLKTCEYYLHSTMRAVVKKYGRLDAVLYHQGESDAIAHTPTTQYSKILKSIIDAATIIYKTKWFIARASNCCGGITSPSQQIRSAQWSINGTFKGPDTDLIIPCSTRWDNCHFTPKNAQIVATAWASAIISRELI